MNLENEQNTQIAAARARIAELEAHVDILKGMHDSLEGEYLNEEKRSDALVKRVQRLEMMHRVTEAQLNEYIFKVKDSQERERQLREALESLIFTVHSHGSPYFKSALKSARAVLDDLASPESQL